MEYIINCAVISSREEFHRVLAKTLSFPAYYGHNLDALHDVLTSITEDTHLVLENWDTLPASFQGFHVVLNHAEDENPCFTVTFAR